MNTTPKNPAAVALGQMNKGKRKSLSQEQRDAARERLANARLRRWLKTPQQEIGQ